VYKRQFSAGKHFEIKKRPSMKDSLFSKDFIALKLQFFTKLKKQKSY
jgi:hypothetical protein